MTRCAKFHHLYDEVGNFCGMSATSISYYKAYREIVKKLVGLGLDEDFVFENFPEGPGRIVSSIKDDETRTKALNYVAGCLKRKEKVTEGDLRATIKAWRETEAGSCSTSEHSTRSEKLTNVKKEDPPTPEIEKEPEIVKEKIPIVQVSVQGSSKPLPGDWINKPPRNAEEIKKAEREELEAAAERLLALMPKSTQLIVTDQLREHTSWKVKDVFYYGCEALAEKRGKK